MAHEAGKGDNRRPEDKKAFDEGYDRIFGKKPAKEVSNEERIEQVNKLQKELYDKN